MAEDREEAAGEEPAGGFDFWELYRYQKVMFRVVYATVPLMLAGVYFFGWRVLAMVAVSVVAGSFAEWLFCRARGEPISSAVFVTAVLYALILPPRTPFYVVVVGIVVAIVFGKEVFGGYARNIFNPALVGRCFVYVCFPVALTAEWLKPFAEWPAGLVHWARSAEAFTRATPLTMYRTGEGATALWRMLIGNVGGTAGATSSLLIVGAGVYLALTKTANWRLIVGTLLGALVASAAFHYGGAETVPGPVFTLFSGGLLFGAVYMVTDPISAAQSNEGRWIFGIEVGILTVIIRGFSNWYEGVMFAILIGNMFNPIMEHYLRRYKSWRRERAEGES
ncbi:MAG: RnfABCDGE type electron transport complex subunit D [Planctomycetota bacterium]